MNRDIASTPEAAVHARYSGAAHALEAELCCPSTYDPLYLEVIPREVLQPRDDRGVRLLLRIGGPVLLKTTMRPGVAASPLQSRTRLAFKIGGR